MITLLRVLFGFIIACFVAGVVTVAFVVTPADIAALVAPDCAGGDSTGGRISFPLVDAF